MIHPYPDIILATTNQHKIEEIQAVNPFQERLLFLTPKSVPNFPTTIEETGATLEENAFIKARTVFETTGCACLADDSGLEVEMLGGAPGVYSARFAGEPSVDAHNRKKLLSEMRKIPTHERQAAFRTVLCYADPLRTLFFEGVIHGRISIEERGHHGFGYDSVFIPDGFEKTFAEMELNQKNSISHRFRALTEFFTAISQYWQ